MIPFLLAQAGSTASLFEMLKVLFLLAAIGAVVYYIQQIPKLEPFRVVINIIVFLVVGWWLLGYIERFF